MRELPRLAIAFRTDCGPPPPDSDLSVAFVVGSLSAFQIVTTGSVRSVRLTSNSPPACGPTGYFNRMRRDQNSAGR
jgi:hypothetical protein